MPANRGIQISSETLNLLILSDFLYYWAKSKMLGGLRCPITLAESRYLNFTNNGTYSDLLLECSERVCLSGTHSAAQCRVHCFALLCSRAFHYAVDSCTPALLNLL